MMIPQTILEREDIALGTSGIMLAETIAGTVFLAVCEKLFRSKLQTELARLAPVADPGLVMAKGAANLKSLMAEIYGDDVTKQILVAYSNALGPVWIVSVVLGYGELGSCTTNERASA